LGIDLALWQMMQKSLAEASSAGKDVIPQRLFEQINEDARY